VQFRVNCPSIQLKKQALIQMSTICA